MRKSVKHGMSIRIPDVSIVILTKNGKGYIQSVLDSIFAQRTTYSFEVIVIDSGSTDSTVQIIKKYPVRLKEISAFEFGHGKTRNYGASIARGKYVIFLTQDAVPTNENWFQFLVKPMENDEQIAGVFSRHLPRKDCHPMEEREIVNSLIGSNIPKKSFIEDMNKYRNNFLPYIFFANTSACIKKSVLEKFPFAEIDFAEDQEWAKRILEAGFATFFEPRSTVFHSHSYSAFQNLRRNYDHAKAFKALFGYKGFSNLVRAIFSAAKETLLDYRFVAGKRELTFIGKMRWFLRSPLWHLARVLGQFLGANYAILPRSLDGILSFQKKVIRG